MVKLVLTRYTHAGPALASLTVLKDGRYYILRPTEPVNCELEGVGIDEENLLLILPDGRKVALEIVKEVQGEGVYSRLPRLSPDEAS